MDESPKMFLLSAKLSGVKNIQKCIELDFYKKSIDSSFDPEKYRIKAVFGENGFGKTAIITAFSIYQLLLVRSGYLSDSNTQAYLSETINKKTKKYTMECEFAYLTDNSINVYSHLICLEYVENEFLITEELLRVKNGNNRKSKYTDVYAIKNGELVFVTEDADPERMRLATMNLLSKSSMPAALLGKRELGEINTLTSSLMNMWRFALKMRVSLRSEDQHSMFFLDDDSTKEFSMDVLMNSIVAVSEKRILKNTFPWFEDRIKGVERFIRLFKPDLKSIDIVKRDNGIFYSCELNMNYGDYVINKEFESEGIKKLISIYDALRVAANGGIVFIDEIDANVNSIYLSTIIEYMMLFGKGQLIFTSHNIDIMQVLKDNKYSIDFLNSDQEIVRWTNNGNKSPINAYKNGLIEGMPYNIFPTDFISVFGEV